MESKQLFEILIRENSRMLLTFIRTAVYDETLVDDIWQETMLVAWKRLDDYQTDRPFGAWLRGIAQKVILSRRRTQARQLRLQSDAHFEYINQRFSQLHSLPGDTFAEKLQALRDCVGQLPLDDRKCIELRYMEGLMPGQLSQKLNMALETVKKRLLRAKQKLASCISRKLDATASN